MKVVILAGGRGTRLAEETVRVPKPMVEIGGRPMLWHIMSIYAACGFKNFVIACGYRGEVIKEYVANFAVRHSDFTVDVKRGSRRRIGAGPADWRISAVDTGVDTMTGGRVLRLKRELRGGTFMLTYGDGVGDVDARRLLAFHRAHRKIATVTGVHPPSRFGELILNGPRVTEYSEKPQTGHGWINGGFFVFEPAIFNYLKDDSAVLEREPLEKLAASGQLMAFRHEGFWQPMDTLREKELLEGLWASGRAPWRLGP